MIEYRARLIGAKGQVVREEPLRCSNDETAMLMAEKLLDAVHDVDVWNRNRFLVRLRHGSKC